MPCTRPPAINIPNSQSVVAAEKRRKKMQSLQEKATEWSGVHPNDAFAIEETNLTRSLASRPSSISPPISTTGFALPFHSTFACRGWISCCYLSIWVGGICKLLRFESLAYKIRVSVRKRWIFVKFVDSCLEEWNSAYS